jgi:hypothetical protein
MAMFIQRKKFDHPEFAYATANSFKTIDPSIPGLVKTTATVREIDGDFWVYVTAEGDLVEGQEFLLPDYEVVLGSES